MPNDNVLMAGVRAAAIEECAKLVDALAEKWNQAAQSARDGRYDFMTEAADRCADEIRALAAHPGQPEPRAEVTNPFRELLAALIDIYDDERNNAPEDRCYVEGAWSEVLGEARALLAPLPDPAQVAAESPDWIKNALPPEGA